MEYADSLKHVLIRKINKAERDLVQLKLDYCRFVFGLTHRSCVIKDGQTYRVVSVDVDAMVRREDGQYDKPPIIGVPLEKEEQGESVELGNEWELMEKTQAMGR
ncbi:hypothetical protein QQM79_02705 [Marinobacteraceae bacterium S3BR75-40.1]